MAVVETAQVPQGARCALHPEHEAISVCSRCGSYACQSCTRGRYGRAYCAPCAEALPALAGEGRRLLAAIVDAVLLFSGPTYAVTIVGAILGSEPEGSGGATPMNVTSFVPFGIGALTTVALLGVNLWLVREHGQSIAKHWFGLRVVRSDGSRAHTSRIVLLRNVVPLAISVVPLVGALFQFADSLFILRRDRRCIHDHIADTIVVRVPRSAQRP